MNNSIKKNKRPFLENIHLFRAFAIINVMLVHLWSHKGFDGGLSTANLCRAVLFGNSTIYFIFISGFLFEYLSPTFNLKKYYLKKIKYIVVPFIIWSLVMTMRDSIVLILLHRDTSIQLFLTTCLKNIVLGRASVHFWYIPFIIIVFIISPLLLLVPKKYEKILIFISLILPLLGTRTGTTVTVYQFLYFFPVYVLGFYISKYYEKFEQIVTKYSYVFLIVFLVSTILLFKNIYLANLNFMVFNLKDSVFYIQKISFTFFVVVKLKEIKSNKVLDMFANYSFGLYFLHLFFTYHTFYFMLKVIHDQYYNLSFFMSLILAMAYVTITIVFIWFLKRLFGKNSRMFVGA